MIRNLIAPSILTFPFADLGPSIRQMEEAGAEWLHLDVMDGQFVPPITFGDAMVKSAKALCGLHMEAHLMTLTPERQVEAFAEAGCERLTFHAEVSPHSHRTVQHIHANRMKAGIAINPGTPVEAIHPLIDLVDLVLVMTVNPGYGGQTFLPEALKKVAQVHQIRPDLTIQVDGGIAPSTIRDAYDAGARSFVVGSYLQKPDSIAEAFSQLEAACATNS